MKLLLSLIILILIVCSCSIKKQAVTTKYRYELIKSGSNQPPVVMGEIVSADNRKPFPFSAVKLNKEFLCKADAKGYFKCEFKPGKYHFGAIGVFMEYSETKKMKIDNGDTLKITFYLFDNNQVMH